MTGVQTCALPILAVQFVQPGFESGEFLVLKVDAASQPYLDWLQSSLRQP